MARAALICPALIIMMSASRRDALRVGELHDCVPALLQRQGGFDVDGDAFPVLDDFDEALNTTLAMASDIDIEIEHRHPL